MAKVDTVERLNGAKDRQAYQRDLYSILGIVHYYPKVDMILRNAVEDQK